MPVKLHDHQEDAVDRMHNGCVLYGGTGVGKTITSLAYYYTRVCGGELNKWNSMTKPRDIYVITTATVRDKKSFEIQAALMHVHADPAVSTNGVKITVDSWNNVAKYKDVKDGFFIFDEQRVVGYGAWSKAFIAIAKHNEWILLSATPGDTWLDYIPVFIANGFYRNKTDFTDQHVVWTPRVKYPKVLRYSGVGKLVRHRNDVLVHMPYTRTTTRHHYDIDCSYDEQLFRKVTDKRWHVFENRPLRDTAELFSVMRRVVNSDASRMTAVKSLIEEHPKLIVFYNFDYELEMLRTLVPEGQPASPESLMDLKRKLDSRPSESSSKTTSTSTSTSSPSSGSPSHGNEQTTSHSTSGTTRQSSAKTQPKPSAQSTTSSTTRIGCRLSTSPRPSTTSSTSGDVSASKRQQSRLAKSTTAHTAAPATPPKTSAISVSISNATSTHHSGQGTKETEACSQTPCKGHWTEDKGSGEVFYNCNAWDWLTSPEGLQANSLCEPVASSELVVAEWNGHKHEPIPNSAHWLYLVQYRAGAEGWNCIETDAMCFFSQTYSYRDWWQAHGRIDRLNTPFTDLKYYHLISKSVIDKAIRRALRAKKSFNERSLDVSGLKTAL